MEITADKALYRCWHCGFSGAESFKENKKKDYYVAEVVSIGAHDGYLSSRGISRATYDKYGVGTADNYIRAASSTTKCVVFPYHDVAGKKYGNKYRSVALKGHACSAPLQDLWRIDLVSPDNSPDIIITEGEIDALSIAECGFANVVSIPNGASELAAKPTDDPLPYLWNARDKFDSVKRIILAGDSDKVGEEYQAEIARRIGKHRVWRVIWPEGIKDANDALTKLGKAELRRLVEAAEPWPVSGLYGAEFFFDKVKDIRENGLPPGSSTGYPLLDPLFTVGPGLLTVVTGIPNSGKSEWVDQIMCNLAERYGWRFAVCSFENPPPIHITKLAAKRLRLNAWDHHIPTQQFDEALDWVRLHYSFLYQDDGSLSDLDSILERLKVAVMRYGIRGAVIDPYNYIQRSGNQSETDWISDMLTKVKAFCMGHGVHLFFIAHPTKMRRSEDGQVAIPTGYDISGSAHFFNKADCGITVHREEGSVVTTIKVWKMRFAWQGKLGSMGLTYDPITTTYSDGSPPQDDDMAITFSEDEWIRHG